MTKVQDILCNIYGAGSSQSFKHLSMVGGDVSRKRSIGDVKYLDEKEPQHHGSYDEQLQGQMLQGLQGGGKYGKRAKKNDDVKEWPIYANGTHVPNETFTLFRETFMLNWSLCNARYNSIWICEPHDVVKAYCDEWLKILKEKGLTPNTTDASKFTTEEGWRFTKCIYDIYSQNPPNNANMEYRVDADFPNISLEDIVIRRTNRDGNVAYFKFIDADHILMSDDKKFPDSPTHTTTLKLLAKCQQAVFILEGAIPDAIIQETTSSLKSKTAIYNLTGGSLKPLARKAFEDECKECPEDLQHAAYNFIGKQVLKAIDAGEDPDAVFNKFANDYKGNHLYSAINLLADDDIKLAPIDDMHDVDPEEITQVHKELIKRMKVCKRSDKSKFSKMASHINNCYLKATASASPSTAMIKSILPCYERKSMFYADILTPYIKRNGIKDADKVMEALDEAVEGQQAGAVKARYRCALNDVKPAVDGNTTALNDIIYASYNDEIMSLKVKSEVPMLYKAKKAFRSILKKSSSKISRKTIEDAVEDVAKVDIKDSDDEEPQQPAPKAQQQAPPPQPAPQAPQQPAPQKQMKKDKIEVTDSDEDSDDDDSDSDDDATIVSSFFAMD